MSGLKYLIKCIHNMNYKEMYKTAKYISKKTGKNRLSVLNDIIFCGIHFQAGYNDYKEFEMYLVSNNKRRTYLTRCMNNKIIKKYNSKEKMYILDDKVQFNTLFNDYIKRDWIDLTTHNADDLKNFCNNKSVIITKPSIGKCGIGVDKILLNKDIDFDKLYSKLVQSGQNLVEEYVKQHSDMSALNPSSVNTLRIFTFFDGKEAYHLQTVLKIGNGKSVDNFFNGGMYTFVNKDGIVCTPAVDKNDSVYAIHPKTGEKIVGFAVPMIKEARELAKAAAKKIPEVGYIGWDIAVTENGPLIIEGNSYPGVFQPRSSFSTNGEGIMPLYREYMCI